MVDDILKILDDLAEKEGIKEVRLACTKYLLRKTYAGFEKVKRKPIPKGWVNDAYAKQSGICARCHTHMEIYEATGDHIQPLAKGGSHVRWNIQAVHLKCNSSKGANDFVTESKKEQVGKTRHVSEHRITREKLDDEFL